jgi:D-alanyl-lipoteichoic acid acyltransferase DltB (MBOAT superfamily)
MSAVVSPARAPRVTPTGHASLGRITLPQLAFILVELALLALVIRQFTIESAAFVRLTVLAFAGFAVHALLPLRWRLGAFVLLSLGGIVLVLGLREGAWLMGLGALLIAICHLPIPFWWRVAVLVVVGAGLATMRIAPTVAPWSAAIWPILGSLFMFRLIVYLYDLKHDKESFSLTRVLAYFFLLPNVCFPLFPVVDYRTFRRTYFDLDAAQIYQTGVDWMARGVVHLIAYRFVYYYLTLSPSEVRGPGSFGQFVLANFLLYLRVSGQFHLIVGMLYLFGFRLPETHHRYYLASSFTDFWRRINIYWKDFMLKLFFNPLYFKLRTLGPSRALVIATLVVFAATWALHAYQWFWLRGAVLLAWTDVAFWSILAALVVWNALHETRHGRARRLPGREVPLRERAMTAFKVAATFATICLLWSLWTSDSFGAWFALWGALISSPWSSLRASLPALTVAAMVMAVVGASGLPVNGRVSATRRGAKLPWRTLATVATLAILFLGGIQSVYVKLGPAAATVINSLRSGQLGRTDMALLERGYYEDLVRVDRFNSQLWEVYMNKPANWLDVQGLGLERFTGDFRQKELVPSMGVQTRFGPIHTNRWGMRDREYDRVPAPGTYRVALLGASTVMGWGVADSEVFEAVVEKRLNETRPAAGIARYEILNFAVSGYEPLQQLAVLDKVWDFHPSAMIHVAAGRELLGIAQNLETSLRRGVPIPYPYLQEVARRAGIGTSTDETTALRKLQPLRGEITTWLYGEMVKACRERGVVPILVFLPHIYPGIWEQEATEVMDRARDAGFVVLDLKHVYGKMDGVALRLAEWDAHPNVKGHQMIANGLYDAIVRHAGEILATRETRR